MNETIARLESMIPDPRKGLPEPVFLFASRIMPMINVDLLVRDKAKGTLLAWREDAWYCGWHIPGGIVRYQETLEERIIRTAEKELGCPVDFSPEIRSVHEFIHPDQKDRGHFISLLYFCTLRGELPPEFRYEAGTPKNGQCAWFQHVPEDFLSVQRCYVPFIEGEFLCQTN